MSIGQVDISIEPAQTAMAFLIDLGKRTVITSISQQRPAQVEEAQAAYLRMLDFAFTRTPMLFIATADEQRVGFLLYADFLPDDVTGHDQGFVAYMAVEPHAQGNGIGKKLLAATEAYARAQGITALALMVTEDNAAARAVYESIGFTTERRLLCKML